MEFIKSLKPAVLLGIFGILYLIIADRTSFWINLLFAITLCGLIVLEFVFYPYLVSKRYEILIKPYREKFLKR